MVSTICNQLSEKSGDCNKFTYRRSSSKSAMNSMGIKLDNYRYKNLLASKNVPILFVILCFLIIANTRCDSVGGTNGSDEDRGFSTSSPAPASSTPPAKYDPLDMLREIYLDHNSNKVITMIMPPAGDPVNLQKFHPNGRYGRRSVSSQAESSPSRSELGKLWFNENSGSASGLMLRSIGRNSKNAGSSSAAKNQLATGGQPLADRFATSKSAEDVVMFSDADGANYQQELSKLLRCNFSGVSNLYWCENGPN